MKKAADCCKCGLRSLISWDCGFESRRGHGSLSLLYVVFCQLEAFRSGRSLVQRSATECVVLGGVIVKPR